jgi:hypothetical protein
MSKAMRGFVPVLMGLGLMAGMPARGAAIGTCGLDMMDNIPVSSPVTFGEFCAAFGGAALSHAGSSAALLSTITGIQFDFTLTPVSIFSTDQVTPQFGAQALTGMLTFDVSEVNDKLSNCQTKPITLATTSLTIVCTLDNADTTYLSTYLPSGLYIALPGNDPGSGGTDSVKFSLATLTFLTSTATPEPATFAPLGIGLLALMVIWRARYRRAPA